MRHMSFTWRLIAGGWRSLLALLGVVALLAGTVPWAAAQEATPLAANADPVAAASAWLRAQQDTAGGFKGFSGELDPGTTTDAAMALYAAQESDPEAEAALAAAIAYLEKDGLSYANTGAGQAAKLVLAAVAGGKDPRSFGGADLIAQMQAPPTTSVENPIPGIWGDDLYDHVLVILALAAAGEPVPDTAIAPLRATQGADGGWAFDGATAAGSSDSNTTALAIQALVAAGHGDDPMLANALASLRPLLAPDNTGFAYGPGDPLLADANSTALVVQALIAAGEDPTSPDWGASAQALVAFQAADGGLRFMATDEDANLLATVQGIPALAGMPLPVAQACADSGADIAGCVALAPAA